MYDVRWAVRCGLKMLPGNGMMQGARNACLLSDKLKYFQNLLLNNVNRVVVLRKKPNLATSKLTRMSIRVSMV